MFGLNLPSLFGMGGETPAKKEKKESTRRTSAQVQAKKKRAKVKASRRKNRKSK